MTVLLVAGSPAQRSRSTALLDAVDHRLRARGSRVDRLDVAALSAQALVEGDAAHRSLARAIDQVARARAVVPSTPVQRSSYGGLIKLFVDLLPQAAFHGKTVQPLGTGSTLAHMQALDEAFRPVLLSLGPARILPGIYAPDAEVSLTPEGAHHVGAAVAARLDDAAEQLHVQASSDDEPAGRGAPVPARAHVGPRVLPAVRSCSA